MREILSLWRSPLDKVALTEASAFADRQPRASSIGYGEDFHLMTLFNYGYYLSEPMATPDSALAAMFAAMAPGPYAVGGTAFIPQNGFSVDASSTGFSVPDQANIVSSGTGGENSSDTFFHFVISGASTPGTPALFLNCSPTHTSGGTYFRGLAFEWTGTDLLGTETCIYANSWNCRAINCNFVNCPIAFNAQGLSCGMESCTIQYLAGPPGGTTLATEFPVVILAGPQSYVIGSGEFKQLEIKNLGPTGITCISVENVEHLVIRDVHLYYWSCGINYGIGNNENTTAGTVSSVECESYITCVNMQCANNEAHISAQKYTSCVFFLSTNPGTPNTTPSSLFIIDPNGFGNSNLEDIELNDCSIFQSNLHGLEIKGGQRLRIIGGAYSGNGPSGGAGIAITGNPTGVTILGAHLGAKYNNQTIPQSQQWALLVSGSSPGTIVVDSCQMDGYSASPVSVTGTPSELLISNCPGYNDQNTPIAPTAPTSSVDAATASSITGGVNYYGPSLLIFTNGSSNITFTINGVASTIQASAFVTVFVNSPYDKIQFSAAPAYFHWLGK